MEVAPFLTDRGKENFERLRKILYNKGLDDPLFHIMLSVFAHEMDKYTQVQLDARSRTFEGKPAFYNEFKDSEVLQVNALHTIGKDAFHAMERMSAKFGLTPVDYKKVQELVKESAGSKEDDALLALIGGNVSTT